MSDNCECIPLELWTWKKASGGTFSNINRRIAPARSTTKSHLW